ncbi:LysE family transporter [Phormidium tenue FACHB-886]|nr:LysE family transporter [Phormidium tenue FACHB-886]
MSQSPIGLLGQGIFIGLAIAVPVGPISILCIQRSLKAGFASGLVSGLGASTGDTIYACIGVFGLNLIATSFVNQKIWFGLIGGIFLCYLGIKTFLEKPAVCMDENSSLAQASIRKENLLGDYITTLALDLINPITILIFTTVFAESYTKTVYSSSMAGGFFIIGVFISTALWRICLTGIAKCLSGGLNSRQLQRINQVAGTTISTFGCASIYSALN